MKKLLILGLALILLMATVIPVSASSSSSSTQTTTQTKPIAIYIWVNGTPSPQLSLTAWALSLQYNVQIKQYAGNNAARWMYGVTSAPAITVVFSNGDVNHPIDSFNLYGSQLNYFSVQYAILTAA